MDADLRRPVVVSTRVEREEGPVSIAVRKREGVLWRLPTTAAAPIGAGRAALEARLAGGPRPGWIAVTSPRAASILGTSGSVRATTARPDRPRVAAVGPATAAALRREGLPVDFVSPRASGEALALALSVHARADVARRDARAGAGIVWAGSAQSDGAFGRVLRTHGLEVAEYAIYEVRGVRPPGLDDFVARLSARGIDAVCLFAPSAVAALADALTPRRLRLLARTRLVCFGRSTARAVSSLGLAAHVEIATGRVSDLATAVGDAIDGRERDAS